MSDIFRKLSKYRYEGTLEGLEECLPKFHSTSIVLYNGRPHSGGGGNHSRRKHERKKVRRIDIRIYF